MRLTMWSDGIITEECLNINCLCLRGIIFKKQFDILFSIFFFNSKNKHLKKYDDS